MIRSLVLVPVMLVGGTPVAASEAPERSVTSTAPAAKKVTFYAGLTRGDAAAQEALRAVSDPISPQYRQFPSRSMIKSTYGATPQALAALRDSAERRGLTVRLDRTGVFARITGPAASMAEWLGRPISKAKGEYRGMPFTLFRSTGAPPRNLTDHVTEFLAWDLRVRNQGSSAAAYSGRNTGTPRSCLRRYGADDYTYSYNQLRTAYGLDGYPRGRRVGRSVHAVILSQGDGFSRNALMASAMCFGLPEMTFSRKPVAGLDAALPAGFEGDLDTQVMQSVLPARSRVTVVESVDFDQRIFLSWSQAFALGPQTVSTSYGYCEPDARRLPKGVLSVNESVLLRLTLSGTTAFAASGDRGSSDCINNRTGRGRKVKAVDYPASSPYVVAVGGSRIVLTTDNQRRREVVWNSMGLARPLGPGKIAGGGGRSALFERPWWQQGVLNGERRGLPDLSAHSAEAPGWPLIRVTRGDRERVLTSGGTSAAAPFVAAAVATLAAQQGKGFGLLQPSLYAISSSGMYDITSGNNDLFNRGCCQAKQGYDLASGLGAPRFDHWPELLR